MSVGGFVYRAGILGYCFESQLDSVVVEDEFAVEDHALSVLNPGCAKRSSTIWLGLNKD